MGQAAGTHAESGQEIRDFLEASELRAGDASGPPAMTASRYTYSTDPAGGPAGCSAYAAADTGSGAAAAADANCVEERTHDLSFTESLVRYR